mmetsp:Transcript_11393/g.25554  ORF Transcript_11393/g.25554 Transcript_11393/m.25554 type:complete len:216 (+) Transcript_11393:433-1080(+)
MDVLRRTSGITQDDYRIDVAEVDTADGKVGRHYDLGWLVRTPGPRSSRPVVRGALHGAGAAVDLDAVLCQAEAKLGRHRGLSEVRAEDVLPIRGDDHEGPGSLKLPQRLHRCIYDLGKDEWLDHPQSVSQTSWKSRGTGGILPLGQQLSGECTILDVLVPMTLRHRHALNLHKLHGLVDAETQFPGSGSIQCRRGGYELQRSNSWLPSFLVDDDI